MTTHGKGQGGMQLWTIRCQTHETFILYIITINSGGDACLPLFTCFPGFFFRKGVLYLEVWAPWWPGAWCKWQTLPYMYLPLATVSLACQNYVELKLGFLIYKDFCFYSEFTSNFKKNPGSSGVRFPFWPLSSSMPWHCYMRSNPSAARCYRQPPTNAYPGAIGAGSHKTWWPTGLQMWGINKSTWGLIVNVETILLL